MSLLMEEVETNGGKYFAASSLLLELFSLFFQAVAWFPWKINVLSAICLKQSEKTKGKMTS